MEETTIIYEGAKVAFSVLSVALMTLASIYIPRLAKAAERRLGFDIPDPLEDRAISVAFDAISYADEWGRGQAKKAGRKVLSSAKLDQAARYFRDHASAKVIAWLSGNVEDFIEAKLGQKRAIDENRRPPWAESLRPSLERAILEADPEETARGETTP